MTNKHKTNAKHVLFLYTEHIHSMATLLGTAVRLVVNTDTTLANQMTAAQYKHQNVLKTTS